MDIVNTILAELPNLSMVGKMMTESTFGLVTLVGLAFVLVKLEFSKF